MSEEPKRVVENYRVGSDPLFCIESKPNFQLAEAPDSGKKPSPTGVPYGVVLFHLQGWMDRLGPTLREDAQSSASQIASR